MVQYHTNGVFQVPGRHDGMKFAHHQLHFALELSNKSLEIGPRTRSYRLEYVSENLGKLKLKFYGLSESKLTVRNRQREIWFVVPDVVGEHVAERPGWPLT